jgi:hypothetical protein
MKVAKLALFASVAVGTTTLAFTTPLPPRAVASARSTVCYSTPDETSICDAPEGVQSVSLMDQPLGLSEILQDLVVTAANGNRVRLGDAMGQGTSLVVFLRHLG